MKRSRLKVGTLVMSTMMAVGMLMPFSSYGQGGRSDGFFSGGDNYENRDGGMPEVSGGITNDNFGAPLDSGLLIMASAGIGYLLLKKRRRTLTMLLFAVVMLVMTQCKKPNIAEVADNKCVRITLNVGGNTKADVNPINGVVEFVDGDEIIVANNGVFVGTLTYDGDEFAGTITEPVSSDYLHFYFIGNASTVGLETCVSTGITVDIADQINSLPVISYGHSTEQYSSETQYYEARLQNKCALVKFNVTTPSPFAATCLTGLNNTVTVDFADNSFVYGMENDGKITIAPGNGERWAILLPQDDFSKGDNRAFAGRYTGYCETMPDIHADDYLDEGIDVVMNTLTYPEGALHGLFSVSEDKQVVFAKANLSYVMATGVWRFLDNQYVTIEHYNDDLGTNCSASWVKVITLFEWGQTGYNHGAVSYLPYDTDKGQLNFYAYGNPNYNLYDCTGQADWGYVTISNGGNANKQWRTLTIDEWNYLFTGREDAEKKYGRATVDGYFGVVVVPDDWGDGPAGVSFNYGNSVTCDQNPYTASEWQIMEDAGAMFLPFAGYRYKTIVTGPGSFGRVWASTACDKRNAYVVSFTTSEYNFYRSYQRNSGTSVRLATE